MKMKLVFSRNRSVYNYGQNPGVNGIRSYCPSIFSLNYYAIIQLMNSFSVLKLVIPTLKTTNKLFQTQTEKSTEQIFKQFYAQLTSHPSDTGDRPLASFKYHDLLEPSLIFSKIEPEEDLNQEFQPTKSNSSYANRKCQLQKNMINHRIKSLQYEANNPCEDSLTYEQLKTINAYAISIFDGHGGPQLAEYSRSKINTFIDSFLQDHLKKPVADIGELIKESLKWSYQKIEDTFFETYERQLKMGNKKIRSVGTCGITAIVHNDKIYVGNAGDSQAIFILKEGIGMLSTSKACDRLSVNNKYQRQKIMKKWAGIDDSIITEQSSNIYYLKGRLQPTRTIGDYYLKKQQYYLGNDTFKGPYLSCIPQVGEHKITKAHKYMVIASDGIWDALSKNELLNIIMHEKQIDLNKTFYDNEEEQPPYIKNVVNNILEKASENSGKSVQELKNMQKGMRRNYHDDITLAVISLQNQIE